MADSDVRMPSEADNQAAPAEREDAVVAIARINAVLTGFKWLVGAAGGVACAWVLRDPLMSLAGRHTSVWLGASVRAEADTSIDLADKWFTFVLAALAVSILGNILQRGVILSLKETHKSTVRHLAPTRADWERSIDPTRTGSGLTPDGDTHPRDR